MQEASTAGGLQAVRLFALFCSHFKTFVEFCLSVEKDLKAIDVRLASAERPSGLLMTLLQAGQTKATMHSGGIGVSEPYWALTAWSPLSFTRAWTRWESSQWLQSRWGCQASASDSLLLPQSLNTTDTPPPPRFLGLARGSYDPREDLPLSLSGHRGPLALSLALSRSGLSYRRRKRRNVRRNGTGTEEIGIEPRPQLAA